MNEVCIERCALRRDCSTFEPKENLKLIDMPKFPETSGMSREERFTSVSIYLAKVVDHLQGVEDERNTYVIRGPNPDSSRSSTIPKMSKSKIYYLVSHKKIPHLKLGRNVRIRVSDLQKWMMLQVEK